MKQGLLQVIIVISSSFLPLLSQASSSTIQDGFGANIHLQQRIPTADWNTVMQQAEDHGVQWGREEFNWNVIEPTDNSYDWTKYDAIVQSYQAHQIQILGLLTYSSTWAADSETTPPDLSAWQDYVGTVAEHYKDSITYWEIWNEPNYTGFWNSDVDTYAQYLAAAATAIKTKNPNAKIVLGGLSGADDDFLSQIYDNLEDPNTIDVVAIHPYRVIDGNFNYMPEQTLAGLNTLVSDLYNIKAVSQRRQGRVVPIWLTEVGWSTAITGVTEAQQANYLQRLYTMALSVPDVQKVFWYSWVDDGDQFGLLRTDYTPKISVASYHANVVQLDQQRVVRWGLIKTKLFDNFSTNQGWQFINGQCAHGITTISAEHLNVQYSFDTDNCYGMITVNKTLPPKTRALQFSLKGNNDDTILRVRVQDATGETFQYNLSYMPAQWLRYTVQLKQFSSSWGGDNDQVLDAPLQAFSFVLDHAANGTTTTQQIKIDDIATTTRANRYLYNFQQADMSAISKWNTRRENYNYYVVR